MTKKANVKYFLYDDDRFDYTGLVEPVSQAAMLGYKAVAWNTDLSMTGWWQGRNVIGMTTNDKLFDITKEISQAVQIQETHKPYEELPWLWEKNQGVNDKIVMSADVAMPVSWGTNLQQANFLLRYEDVSRLQPGTDHGQRLWVQPAFFDNKFNTRPIEIYQDPYTGFQDIVVNVQIKPGNYSQYFDFSKSNTLQMKAYDNLLHFEVSQSRQQFSDMLILVEKTLGIDIQNEAGYWSLIQEGITAEMASFPAYAPKWGIGDHGAQQMAMMNLEIYDF